MTQSDVLERLKRLEPALKARGLTALYLFGSFARHEARAESDVDLMFELDPRSQFSLIDQSRVRIDLVEALGREVDLVARQALHRMVREAAEGEKVRVF